MKKRNLNGIAASHAFRNGDWFGSLGPQNHTAKNNKSFFLFLFHSVVSVGRCYFEWIKFLLYCTVEKWQFPSSWGTWKTSAAAAKGSRTTKTFTVCETSGTNIQKKSCNLYCAFFRTRDQSHKCFAWSVGKEIDFHAHQKKKEKVYFIFFFFFFFGSSGAGRDWISLSH